MELEWSILGKDKRIEVVESLKRLVVLVGGRLGCGSLLAKGEQSFERPRFHFKI